MTAEKYYLQSSLSVALQSHFCSDARDVECMNIHVDVELVSLDVTLIVPIRDVYFNFTC